MSDQMNRMEALEWAADYAERTKLFQPVLNRNGYPADGSKLLTAEEKVAQILKIAEWVSGTSS